MKKYSIIYIIIIIALYLAIMIVLYQKENGISFNSDFSIYISGIFAPITAIGTIAVSYLIYKLTSIEKRADDDFKIIIRIYFKIEETFELLKKQNLKDDIWGDHNSYYERQIKVDCILLLNYIRRFPHKKSSTQNLERTIMAIYANPNYEYDFIELARLFQNFCYELNPDWNTLVFTLDNNEKN